MLTKANYPYDKLIAVAIVFCDILHVNAQSPSASPTALNCGGAFVQCPPTLSPTVDLVEQTTEAIMFSVVIAGLAVLSVIFLVAGQYHHVWYPAVAREFGWDSPNDIEPIESFCSTHSQTALVAQAGKRRAVLDDHVDVENVSFAVGDLHSSLKPPTRQKHSNHVKFKDDDETEMKPMGASIPVESSSSVALSAEAEITANMNKDVQSHELLFGDSNISNYEAIAAEPETVYSEIPPADETPEPVPDPVPTPALDTCVLAANETEPTITL